MNSVMTNDRDEWKKCTYCTDPRWDKVMTNDDFG